jgi:hypothetical protein
MTDSTNHTYAPSTIFITEFLWDSPYKENCIPLTKWFIHVHRISHAQNCNATVLSTGIHNLLLMLIVFLGCCTLWLCAVFPVFQRCMLPSSLGPKCVGGHIAVCIRGLTVKFANSPPCACRGSIGQKPQYGLMTLAYQSFTAVLLLIYGSLFLSGIYYCLSVFWYAIARMLELELEQ